ncbi:MAG: hypothetical protein MJZ67_04540 [Bacteroidales bacterium]|nr:hypothetical protein [Bacteroidales bacterium]
MASFTHFASMAAQWGSDRPSMPLRCFFAAASLPLRCRFAAASLRLRCGFAAASLLLRSFFAHSSLILRSRFARLRSASLKGLLDRRMNLVASNNHPSCIEAAPKEVFGVMQQETIFQPLPNLNRCFALPTTEHRRSHRW